MSSHKAPSSGQKVTPGESAPTYQEGAGLVQDSSLAAESARSGGVFSENRGAKSTQQQQSTASSGNTSTSGTGSTGPESQQSYDGSAPTYVQSQYHRDPKGPHGKNLQEGGFEGSGPGNSILAEPGSKDDPARRAEHDFTLSQSKTTRAAGPRQGGLEGQHPYQVLEGERQL